MQGSAVQRLLAATEGLPCERIFEPSVKLTHTGVASDRGLVSVPRAAVTADRIAQICAEISAAPTVHVHFCTLRQVQNGKYVNISSGFTYLKQQVC